MAYKNKNLFATLTLADFYHYGLGELPKNSTKARDLYKKVIQSGSDNNFYVSHAYFNLGLMTHFGDGIEKNVTRAERYYNKSASFEPNAFYPSMAMKYHITLENYDLSEIVSNKIKNAFYSVVTPGITLYTIIAAILLYVMFVVSLYHQKD